jgi:hypothetical protein
MICCNIKSNLSPVLYKYDKKGNKYIGVSHFVCVKCLNNIICDDSFDVPIDKEKTLVYRLSEYHK